MKAFKNNISSRLIAISVLVILHFNLFSTFANQDTSRKLMEKMHVFFIETLADNYEGSGNTHELYKSFINQYFELSKSMDVYEKNLQINKWKLEEINNELFKRDYSHFYYFFCDVIYVGEGDEERAIKLVESYPEMPIHIGIFKRDINRLPGRPKFEESQVICMPINSGFLNQIEKDNLISTLRIKELIECGEINLSILASIFVNGYLLDDLKHTEVQEIVSVAFWKFLCLQAGLDFHFSVEKLEFFLNGN
jgi:hypothetical protein